MSGKIPFVSCEIQVRLFGVADTDQGSGIIIGGSSMLFSDANEEPLDYTPLVLKLLHQAREQLDQSIAEHNGREMTVEEAMAVVRAESQERADSPSTENQTEVFQDIPKKERMN